MKYLSTALAISVLSLILFLGCAKDSPTNSNQGAGGDFTIIIGPGTAPEYSWTVGNAFSVTVVRTATPTTIVWGLATPGQNGLTSPVTHGSVQSGAIETSATEPALTAGVEYRVSVTRLDGSFGFTDFTP